MCGINEVDIIVKKTERIEIKKFNLCRLLEAKAFSLVIQYFLSLPRNIILRCI